MEPTKVRVTYFQMSDLGKPYYSHNLNQNISQFYFFKFGGNQGNSHSLVYHLEIQQKQKGYILLHDLEIGEKSPCLRTRAVQFPLEEGQ